MESRKGTRRKVIVLLMVAVMMLSVATVATSCGSAGTTESEASSSVKLPPGATEESLGETATAVETDSGEETSAEETGVENGTGEETTQETATNPATAVDLTGGRFTVVDAFREDSNADVISGDAREIPGDYLEIELQVDNVGTDLIDLSHYSFRLKSPGIAADTYDDYYGDDGTCGYYVSENEISATLLDYSNLGPATYVMKIGETVDKVFLFYDLNPESVHRNENVTRDNTRLVIYKCEGTDYGEEVEVGLAGYPNS